MQIVVHHCEHIKFILALAQEYSFQPILRNANLPLQYFGSQYFITALKQATELYPQVKLQFYCDLGPNYIEVLPALKQGLRAFYCQVKPVKLQASLQKMVKNVGGTIEFNLPEIALDLAVEPQAKDLCLAAYRKHVE